MVSVMSLLFIIASLATGSLPALMQNPEQFIQSIKDGEDERQGHIDRHVAAQARYNSADSAHKLATDERNTAAGNVKTQEGVVAKHSSDEKAAKDTRDEKARVLEAATSDEAKKASFRVREERRIDAEKALLEQIVEKLLTLIPGVNLIEGQLVVTDYIVGRNLLSDSNAERDSVQKVVDKVNSMVSRGETQRKAAIDADEAAKEALRVATDDHKDAVQKYDSAAQTLAASESLLAQLKSELSVKENLLGAAKSELDDATSDLANKKEIREREEKRINSEKATMEEILEILDGLSKSF